MDKLVQAFLVDFIGAFRVVTDEPELLQGNVKEVIGMRPHEREGSETATNLIKRRLQRFGRHTDGADRVDATGAAAPVGRIMAAINHLHTGTECLPDAPVGCILPARRHAVMRYWRSCSSPPRGFRRE